MKYQRIIFVDENGTCRAPMAAEILRECLLDDPLEIVARGLVVLFPEPLNQKADAVMISNGIHVENYQTVGLSPADVTEQTLLICFEDAQRERILKLLPPEFPEGQVRVLHELTGDELEIMNPYGAPLPTYGLLFESLNKAIFKLAKRMEKEEESNGERIGNGSSADPA